MFKWFFEDDKMIIDHIKGLMVAENEGKRPENENVVIILCCAFKDYQREILPSTIIDICKVSIKTFIIFH